MSYTEIGLIYRVCNLQLMYCVDKAHVFFFDLSLCIMVPSDFVIHFLAVVNEKWSVCNCNYQTAILKPHRKITQVKQ